MRDEFPDFQIGELVEAQTKLFDDTRLVARPGDLGFVIARCEGHLPTVYWPGTGRVCDFDPSRGRLMCDPIATRNETP